MVSGSALASRARCLPSAAFISLAQERLEPRHFGQGFLLGLALGLLRLALHLPGVYRSPRRLSRLIQRPLDGALLAQCL